VTHPGHPSDEQLWSGDEALGSHVAGCRECRARRDELDAQQREVRGLLQGSSGVGTKPPRMPDHVTARLDDVVSREVDRRASGAVVRSLSSVPPRRRASPGRPWLVAAAVAGVAVVGGALLVPALDRAELLAGGGDDAGTEVLDAEARAADESTSAAEAGPAADLAAVPIPTIPPDVAEQAARRTDDAGLGSCGKALADEVGGAVVAATEVTGNPRGGVLVRLDSDGQWQLWWLPRCEATSALAWGRNEPT
jgi:hypothetical protein